MLTTREHTGEWSEQILNGTSAQCYTVPFTLVHAGKYRTARKIKMQTIQKLNITQKQQRTQNTAKQNYPGSVTFDDTLPGNYRWTLTLPSLHGADRTTNNTHL